MNICESCKKESNLIPEILPLCRECIIKNFDKYSNLIYRIHKKTRIEYNLPSRIPNDKNGIICRICGNNCRIGEDEKGFCGIRSNKNGSLVHIKGKETDGLLSYYFDPLPTNCVASWVCPASNKINKNWEKYSYSKGTEYGYKNLAVFYETCSFNCLFCQNWTYRTSTAKKESISAKELASAFDENTACICYFGGDPGTQVAHSIKTAEIAIKRSNRILRICWETNGNIDDRHLKKMSEIVSITYGCIKFDLKAFTEEISIALCGVSNKKTLENFRTLAEMRIRIGYPPPLVASTLMIPGYINEDEVFRIAKYISKIDPDIPYSLLGFYPAFYFSDMPPTSKGQAYKCRDAALAAGLNNVNLGNKHIFNMI